jgi:hypothetical protein
MGIETTCECELLINPECLAQSLAASPLKPASQMSGHRRHAVAAAIHSRDIGGPKAGTQVLRHFVNANCSLILSVWRGVWQRVH